MGNRVMRPLHLDKEDFLETSLHKINLQKLVVDFLEIKLQLVVLALEVGFSDRETRHRVLKLMLQLRTLLELVSRMSLQRLVAPLR